MSLYDRIKQTKKMSSREKLDLHSIENCCLVSYSDTKSAFLIIAPVNLNVVSKGVIETLVGNLEKAIGQIGTLEFLCVNSAQDYETNKRFFHRRMALEQNDTLREIDQMDIEFLDDIQVQMATSREFLIVLRFQARESVQQVMTILDKARKIMAENGFNVQAAGKEDIKKILAIYLEQNIYDGNMQNFDGEYFAPMLEVKQ
ncbi:hypothetical protein [Faecalispora sporosphaeroides]|uniref:Uncharacterized protein n=1 Tax=Faecalispora sporosphaeroides TaxID=1549 RepID=A0A928KZ18_9FIRM|nr:hypothetical protein [Faecalispora sporosphaeroides]MBE6834264.1 hypothetical protein [Faecalispora sporosphaeroides]